MPKKLGKYRLPKKRQPTIIAQPLEQLLGSQKEVKGFEKGYGTPPGDWTGSVAEWAIAWALTIRGEEYTTQMNLMGGRLVLGGVVVDFFVPSRNLIIRVQGQYWHYDKAAQVIAADQLTKQSLEAQGYLVIDIDEDDALSNPIYFVAEALEGRDHSRVARGVL